MDLDNVEFLLEQLVSINQDLLIEVKDLKAEVKEELNWTGTHTYGNIMYEV